MRIIYFDICAIVLSLTVLLFLVSKRYTRGRTNRLLLVLAELFIVAGLLDVFDSLFGTYVAQSPGNATIQFVTNTIFYILRNLATPTYMLLIYSYYGIWHKLKKNSVDLWAVALPFAAIVVIILSNVFTHSLFYVDENGVYTRGGGIGSLYVFAVFQLIYMTYILVRYRHTIRRSEFFMLIAFVPLNMLAVIVQRVHMGLRMEMLSLALTLFMIATALQRPEEVIDAAVGTLGMHGFLTDMYKAYSVNRPMNILFIKVRNHRVLRTNLGLEIYNSLLRRVSDKFSTMSRMINLYTDVFYNGRGVFAIVTEGDKYEETLNYGRMTVAYLQESFMLNNLEIRLDAQVCLARCPKDIETYNTLLRFNNRFHKILPEMDQVIILSEVMESKDFKIKNEIDDIIKKGIAGNRFRMYYQPIYSVAQDRFVSAEALIRLEDDKYGFVSPAIFIPAAEESGAIHDIGDFVLEDVCRFIHRAEFAESGLEYIEINLSVAQCIELNLVEKIRGLISKYKVKTSQINLEITETAVDYDPKITDRNIFTLNKMGFKFSLDDYGTGYSNIKRVVSLPLDIVKFDKSFVDEMDDPNMWTAIINTVDMLKKMNKKILVEGVEDKRTLDRFVELGCDYIQGFYFSKPLSQSDFIKFVNEHGGGKVNKVL